MNDDPTVREFLYEWLFNKGLFEDEANAILDGVDHGALTEIYGKRIGEYPTALRATSVMVVEAIAADWLKENFPRHGARPLFDPPSLDTPQTAADPA